MIDRFEKFSLAIAEINRCWHKIAAGELSKYDLKASHVTYLLTLARYPEGLTAPKLAELCDRDKADVSRALGLLDKKGLVTRVDPEGKAYRAPLTLTREGREIAGHINHRAEAAVELASKGLPEEKRAVFYEALELITSNLQKLSKEGIPQK